MRDVTVRWGTKEEKVRWRDHQAYADPRTFEIMLVWGPSYGVSILGLVETLVHEIVHLLLHDLRLYRPDVEDGQEDGWDHVDSKPWHSVTGWHDDYPGWALEAVNVQKPVASAHGL